MSTTVFSRQRVRHELGLRAVTVVASRDLGPRLRRVTFDADLTGFVSLAPADHVKVFFPDPQTGELNAPRIVDDALVRPAGPVTARDYTPLLHSGRLELDFVLHGDHGPASRWASRAVPGDSLVVAGPRGSILPPAGPERYVIGGDETALPAISRWLRSIEADLPVTVLAEVQDSSDERYPLPVGARHEVRWLHRGEAPAGTTTLLADAVRELAPPPAAFWWFGGEATSLVPLRRYLRRELGLDKSAVDVDGYWKRDTSEYDHHAPLDPSDPESP